MRPMRVMVFVALLVASSAALADDRIERLADALSRGQAGAVAGLLEAGLSVGGSDGEAAWRAVLNGLTAVCDKTPFPEAEVSKSLSLLAAKGFPIDRVDENGNTLLMSAAQFCPAPVTSSLLSLGASPGPVNKQHFTPLQMALVLGRWDTAEVLVGAGARLSREEIGQIFFEPPTKSAQRDLLARATR